MSALFVKVVTLLGLFGIPSIFSISMWCFQQCKKFKKHLVILMQAQKAQMRSQLLTQYHEYELNGWVSEDDLEDWEGVDLHTQSTREAFPDLDVHSAEFKKMRSIGKRVNF